MKEERGEFEMFRTSETQMSPNSCKVCIADDVEVIEDGALCGLKELKKLILPNNIEEIGSWAFYGCTSLAEVELPQSVKKIGENAFFDTAFYNDDANWCDEVLYLGCSLIKAQERINGSCFIREGTEVISQGAFKNCTLLERVLIPATVNRIGNNAFEGCESLKAVYGEMDSAAEKYAEENGIKFIAVEFN